MPTYHLDTSALVKRYIREAGSEAVNALYEQAERGEAQLRVPMWNIGELLGVLTERRRQGRLTPREYSAVLESFASETVRLHRFGALRLPEVRTEALAETWPIIVSEGLYEADALQLALSAPERGILVSADGELLKVARKRAVTVLDVSK